MLQHKTEHVGQESTLLEHTRSRVFARKQNKKGVSGLCHKTMNKLDEVTEP